MVGISVLLVKKTTIERMLVGGKIYKLKRWKWMLVKAFQQMYVIISSVVDPGPLSKYSQVPDIQVGPN